MLRTTGALISCLLISLPALAAEKPGVVYGPLEKDEEEVDYPDVLVRLNIIRVGKNKKPGDLAFHQIRSVTGFGLARHATSNRREIDYDSPTQELRTTTGNVNFGAAGVNYGSHTNYVGTDNDSLFNMEYEVGLGTFHWTGRRGDQDFDETGVTIQGSLTAEWGSAFVKPQRCGGFLLGHTDGDVELNIAPGSEVDSNVFDSSLSRGRFDARVESGLLCHRDGTAVRLGTGAGVMVRSLDGMKKLISMAQGIYFHAFGKNFYVRASGEFNLMMYKRNGFFLETQQEAGIRYRARRRKVGFFAGIQLLQQLNFRWQKWDPVETGGDQDEVGRAFETQVKAGIEF